VVALKFQLPSPLLSTRSDTRPQVSRLGPTLRECYSRGVPFRRLACLSTLLDLIPYLKFPDWVSLRPALRLFVLLFVAALRRRLSRRLSRPLKHAINNC
jgi:hypothetical protein